MEWTQSASLDSSSLLCCTVRPKLLHLNTTGDTDSRFCIFTSQRRKIQPSNHHGGHQEEDADAEAGQGERHRPGRAGRDGQESSRGQMQAAGGRADRPPEEDEADRG
ncbi:hypothetical protein E3U43_006979 [Larimichthys crocea]|uniref:Uncharacterized protein n=1 Tax=Larimichthys crocea TaxID=215358 RepID=A0ACD3RLT2_LARCR|nr:hypothetical protein E3U43_006979 [Larimichthys crocea]